MQQATANNIAEGISGCYGAWLEGKCGGDSGGNNMLSTMANHEDR